MLFRINIGALADERLKMRKMKDSNLVSISVLLEMKGKARVKWKEGGSRESEVPKGERGDATQGQNEPIGADYRILPVDPSPCRGTHRSCDVNFDIGRS